MATAHHLSVSPRNCERGVILMMIMIILPTTSMNISLPTYANSLDLQSIAITLFEWNFGRVAHGFRMKK